MQLPTRPQLVAISAASVVFTLQAKAARGPGACFLSCSKEWRDRNGHCSSPCGVESQVRRGVKAREWGREGIREHVWLRSGSGEGIFNRRSEASECKVG